MRTKFICLIWIAELFRNSRLQSQLIDFIKLLTLNYNRCFAKVSRDTTAGCQPDTDLWWKCRWRVPARWCGRGSSPWGTEPSRADVTPDARPLWWASWNLPPSGLCRWWKRLWRRQRRRCWWRNTIWRTLASAAIPTSPVNTSVEWLLTYLGIKKMLFCKCVTKVATEG